MKTQDLIHALGIRTELIEEGVSLEPALIWGDYSFLEWGSQLVWTNSGETIVRMLPGIGTALHEACHAVLPDSDETLVFAFEYLVAHELTGEDRKAWEISFSICVVCENGTEGFSILKGEKPQEWLDAFDWLEEHGFTIRGKPVYGLGPGPKIGENVKFWVCLNSEFTSEIPKWGLNYEFSHSSSRYETWSRK